MCYQMVHMEAAYRVLQKMDWIEKQGDYMLGAIAPDSVHFNPQYNLTLKANSHLWSFGPRWGMTVESDKWRDCVTTYWDAHKTETNRDYIAGYCVHVLTDWLNDKTIFAPFRQQIKSVEEYDDVYAVYAKEAYGSDQWLYQQSSNSVRIMELLAKGEPYSMHGCVVKSEVAFQKEHILKKQYAGSERIDISKYQYCTETVTRDFLDECVQTISNLIKK